MSTNTTSMPLVLPKALKAGDTIGVVSPAAPSDENLFEQGVNYLKQLGFNVVLMPNAKKNNYYVAGTVDERLSDFKQAFLDKEINGILCARGGYGSMQILPHIDWQWVKENPKVFIGFSDLTVILLTMLGQTGMASFHGPMLTSNLIENNQPTQDALWQMVMGNLNYPNVILKPEANEYTCIKPGRAQGKLMGGNLSLLCALCGTPYQPDFTDAILFIEDWHESYYSIDRQWQQLKFSGVFNNIKALVLGDFVEIMDSDTWPDFDLADYFKALTQDLEVPVGLGLKFGHGAQTATLPVGAACRFEASSGHLEILHAPVC